MLFLLFTCFHTLKALNSSYLGTVINFTSAFLRSFKINKQLDDGKEILNLFLFCQKLFNKKRVDISFWWQIIAYKNVSKRKRKK